jgi:hypothetical protein
MIMVASLILLVFWWCIPWASRFLTASIAEAGQFGDSFGSVNALFTGLAFLGALFAIYLQIDERKRRDQELREADSEAKFRAGKFAQVCIARQINHVFGVMSEDWKAHKDLDPVNRMTKPRPTANVFETEAVDLKSIIFLQSKDAPNLLMRLGTLQDRYRALIRLIRERDSLLLGCLLIQKTSGSPANRDAMTVDEIRLLSLTNATYQQSSDYFELARQVFEELRSSLKGMFPERTFMNIDFAQYSI